jgi:hypothetical protein
MTPNTELARFIQTFNPHFLLQVNPLLDHCPRQIVFVLTIHSIEPTIKKWFVGIMKLTPVAIWNSHYIGYVACRSEI